jgi:sugar phosphate isomerase/epimerase
VRWPIGCFDRPFTTWSFDEALKEIAAAGHRTTGLLTRTKDEPFVGADATPEYLARLKQRLGASGLTANMAALRSRRDVPLDDSIRHVRKQIDNARELAIASLLIFGVDKPAEYENYYKVMKDAAAYAAERRIKLALKGAEFDGPIMVECCQIGATPEETMANARANRLFIEKLLNAS